ncbi:MULTISPECIES: hypothetical protein [unclassified Micromonospora]|uniref:hypothetical protein n=1 Tax=unclassified Micromonospora TaxID=2617518 RepID=UPI003A881158
MVTAVLGAFGAATGSMLGAATLTDLPSDTAMVDLTRRASGVEAPSVVLRQTSARTADRVFTAGTLDGRWDASQARQRYAAAGWSVSEIEVVHDQAGVADPAAWTSDYIPSRYDRFTAEHHGLVVAIAGMSVGGKTTVGVDAWAAGSPVLRILLVAGVALGLSAGWLLAAAVARRIHSTHPAHRITVAALSATTVLVLAAPVVALYVSLAHAIRPHAHTGGPLPSVHHALSPVPYWTAAPPWLLPASSAVGGLLVIVTVVFAARPQPARLAAVGIPTGGVRIDDDFEVAANMVKDSIAEARTDRRAAQRLLFLSAYPDWTPDPLDRMRGRLIDSGVPAAFLTTTQPSGPPQP